MVRVIIPDRNVKITNSEKAGEYLKGIGVIYERWGTRVIDPENSGSDQILESYKEDILFTVLSPAKAFFTESQCQFSLMNSLI